LVTEARDEGLVGVLGNQLGALLVNHEHQPRWSKRRDLLLGSGHGLSRQQEHGADEGEQAGSHSEKFPEAGAELYVKDRMGRFSVIRQSV